MAISDSVNNQVILSSRPVGVPQAEHFELVESAIPEIKDGEYLVRSKYLSVDPAMRGWTNAAKNYSEPVAIGAVMRSPAAAEVVQSKNPDFKEGDLLVGDFGWQEYAVGNGTELRFRVPETPGIDVPLSAYLGVLGSTGLTAYFGLLSYGEPKAGETVVVSTAAGSVGSVVGQIAKIKGCRTIGFTGSDEKVETCKNEFGYDEAYNYKTADLDAVIKAACPDGVDVYFDCTSGSITDAVYANLALRARCVVCGTASIHVWDPLPTGPRVERALLVNRARIQGLVVYDFRDQWVEGQKELSQWLAEGKLNYREDKLQGLDKAPSAIQRLYDGANQGKLMIEI